MSDVKVVIALLCKHLNLSTGATLKPEHFRLAKYDKRTDNTVFEMWTLLCLLSSSAVKEREDAVDFHDYDRITRAKLHLAYLQYPVVEFYASPPNNTCSSRELLVAIGWLLATQNVLSSAVKEKISSSILGEEFSNTETLETDATECPEVSTVNSQMNSVIHMCGKISSNLKAISELASEKIKLTSKIHTASLGASGLPHLSVSEMALTKRYAMNGKKMSTKDQKRLHELHELATMLDTHEKWNKKQHIFFDWMTTVMEEQKKSQEESLCLTEEAERELLKFIGTLRHIVKKNLRSLKHNKGTEESSRRETNCVSRFLRVEAKNTEAERLLLEATAHLELEEAAVVKRKAQLANELEAMLKLIPNCIQV